MKQRRLHALDVLFLLIGIAGVQAAGTTARNLIVIDTAVFDTATHRFLVSWSLDTSDVPAALEAAFVALCGPSPLPPEPGNIFSIAALSGDSSFQVEPLRFDTTYRIGMWCALQGVWIPPDSLYEFSVPKATWEPVSLFSTAVDDTIAVLQQRILLWRDASYGSGIPLHHDTVRCYDLPAERRNGFLETGNGFRFAAPVSLPELYIGFRLDSLSKSGPSPGIFRDSGGMLLAEHATVRDTARRLVYVKTARFDLPFLLLADTVAPRVIFTGDTSRSISSQALDCSFSLRDNAAGCRWRLFSVPGGEPPFSASAAFSGSAGDTVQEISCQLPVTGAHEAGLRVMLTVDDGTTSDTINVSRRAIRSRCNETTTPAGMIMPLAPAAELDSAGCRHALRTLFKRAEGSYAKSVFRVFKWQGSSGGGYGWLEYSSDNDERFTFFPGSLFWLISRGEVMIDLGDGRSPSLKDTLSIDLPAGAWTDFSSPYGFPVACSDLVAATGDGAPSLHFHQWSKDELRRTWRADPLYCGSVPGFDDPATVLPYGTNGYFTVFNTSDSTIRLRIPPVPPENRTAAAKARAGLPAGRGWSIRFDLEHGRSIAARAICAASADRRTPLSIPPPPGFGGPSIAVGRPGGKRSCGTLVLPVNRTDPLTFELIVTNSDASPATVTCSPTLIAGAAEGSIAVDQSIRPLLAPFSMTVDAHESRTLLCSVGSPPPAGWSSSQNEPAGARIVSLSRPAHGGSALIVRIVSPARQNRIELFDLNGRRCGATQCRQANRGGGFIAAVQPGPSACSCYLVRLTAVNDDGTTANHLRTMMLLP
ncbi:MAG: hypothetical protein JW913_09370 [Chitinispirillaceae bacterium]|nr:hypothetical protein [Chitinispirillaceae bacterium]